MRLQTNPMSFEATAATFFIILLICLICIFLLLMVFLHKCFKIKDVGTGSSCTGEDCLVEKKVSRNQQKTINVRQIMDLNIPPPPGILVQRQNKEKGPPASENKENEADNEEDNNKNNKEDNKEEKNEDGTGNAGEGDLQSAPLNTDKRPLKGVTFSKEVIVVDLGKEIPTTRSYAREHKERK